MLLNFERRPQESCRFCLSVLECSLWRSQKPDSPWVRSPSILKAPEGETVYKGAVHGAEKLSYRWALQPQLPQRGLGMDHPTKPSPASQKHDQNKIAILSHQVWSTLLHNKRRHAFSWDLHLELSEAERQCHARIPRGRRLLLLGILKQRFDMQGTFFLGFHP